MSFAACHRSYIYANRVNDSSASTASCRRPEVPRKTATTAEPTP